MTIPRAFNRSAIPCKLSPASLAARTIGNTSSYTGPAKASRFAFAAGAPRLAPVREIWLQVPDWRLGQLLVNAVSPKQSSPDLFSVEDTELEKLLARLSEQIRRWQGGHEWPNDG